MHPGPAPRPGVLQHAARQELGLPAPAGAHVCLDLGEEEYTRGRPHPMIDPEARIELLREQGARPGRRGGPARRGARPRRARRPGRRAGPGLRARSPPRRPAVVAYVLGTEQDPQGFARQRRRSATAGCLVTETAARAALAAAAIAPRDPALAETEPRAAARDGGAGRTGVALVTYSTKPRGGVVHTLALAEALHRRRRRRARRRPRRPDAGFFRPIDGAAHVLVPAPAATGRSRRGCSPSIDALTTGLGELAAGSTCCTPRTASPPGRRRGSATRARGPVVRTVHHVDDFTTPALIDCQRQAIVEPDRVLVVSEQLAAHPARRVRRRRRRRAQRGRPGRFPPVGAGPAGARSAARVGADGPVPLPRGRRDRAAQGQRPRCSRALGQLRAGLAPPRCWPSSAGTRSRTTRLPRGGPRRLPGSGLRLGEDVVLLGTVPDGELGGWYRAADALAFPSVKEGWGLVVLEAMAAGLPVVASDLPVFREYLVDGENALLPGGDTGAGRRDDGDVRGHGPAPAFVAGGLNTAGRYRWSASAQRHAAIYDEVRATRAPAVRRG